MSLSSYKVDNFHFCTQKTPYFHIHEQVIAKPKGEYQKYINGIDEDVVEDYLTLGWIEPL